MTAPSPAETFRALHRPGTPLILWNIWDAGSARAIVAEGAPAVATGSASVAGAWGYEDGEQLPFDLLLTVTRRIAASVPVPLSVDLETGFGATPDAVAASARAVEAAGAVGVNLEDGLLPEGGLRPVADQAARLSAARAATGLFLNARTDLFLQAPPEVHAGLIDDALERARAYAQAGADGLFVPLLSDPALIARLCREQPLPVNVMARPGMPALAALADLGVARISFGPGPWRGAMAALGRAFAGETAIRA